MFPNNVLVSSFCLLKRDGGSLSFYSRSRIIIFNRIKMIKCILIRFDCSFISKDELSYKNLKGSAAECTSHQNFGAGVKWGFSEKASIIQG